MTQRRAIVLACGLAFGLAFAAATYWLKPPSADQQGPTPKPLR